MRLLTNVPCANYTALNASVREAFKGECESWFLNATGGPAAVTINCDAAPARRRRRGSVRNLVMSFTLVDGFTSAEAAIASDTVAGLFDSGASVSAPNVHFVVDSRTVVETTADTVCEQGFYFDNDIHQCRPCINAIEFDPRTSDELGVVNEECAPITTACDAGEYLIVFTRDGKTDNTCGPCGVGTYGTNLPGSDTDGVTPETCDLCGVGYGKAATTSAFTCVVCSRTEGTFNNEIDDSPCGNYTACTAGHGFDCVDGSDCTGLADLDQNCTDAEVRTRCPITCHTCPANSCTPCAAGTFKSTDDHYTACDAVSACEAGSRLVRVGSNATFEGTCGPSPPNPGKDTPWIETDVGVGVMIVVAVLLVVGAGASIKCLRGSKLLGGMDDSSAPMVITVHE